MRWWPPPRRVLEGAIVRLEPIEPRHADPLLRASRDPEIWAWIDRRVGASELAFRDWFENRLVASEAGREWCFITHSALGGQTIGSSSFLNVRPEHNGLEIGWTWLLPAAWQTGANVEAKLMMLEFAFEELGCMRVEFKTDSRNERSRGALEALPANFEGIFRKHMLMPGIGVRDSAYFAIVEDDWPTVKAGLIDRVSAKLGAEGEVVANRA